MSRDMEQNNAAAIVFGAIAFLIWGPSLLKFSFRVAFEIAVFVIALIVIFLMTLGCMGLLQ